MKAKFKDYTLPIIFIGLMGILKLYPYPGRARMTRNIIRIEGTAYNLVPFRTILGYVKGFDNYNLDIIIRFFTVNLLLFMPLGFLLSRPRTNMSKKIDYLLIIFTPLLIDLFQAILKVGLFDIDAVILNILGCLLVYKVFTSNKKTVCL